MRVGNMRYDVKFLKRTITRDPDSKQRVETWTDGDTIKCSAVGSSNKGTNNESRIYNEVKTIECWNVTDIDETFRAVFQGKTYDIDSIEPLSYDNRKLQIKLIKIND